MFEGQKDDLLGLRILNLVDGLDPFVVDALGLHRPLEVHREGLLLLLVTGRVRLVRLELDET